MPPEVAALRTMPDRLWHAGQVLRLAGRLGLSDDALATRAIPVLQHEQRAHSASIVRAVTASVVRNTHARARSLAHIQPDRPGREVPEQRALPRRADRRQ